MTEDQQRIVQQLVSRVYEMEAMGHPCGSTLAMIRKEVDGELFDEVRRALGILGPAEAKRPGPSEERYCYVNCGLPGDQCACYRQMMQEGHAAGAIEEVRKAVGE